MKGGRPLGTPLVDRAGRVDRDGPRTALRAGELPGHAPNAGPASGPHRKSRRPLFDRAGVATRILDWDRHWDEPESPLAVLGDSGARRYVAGVAWHCYNGDVVAQTPVHDAYPEKEVYFTECSGGQWAPNWADNLVWYTRTLVIGSTRGWAKGVLLWNLALGSTVLIVVNPGKLGRTFAVRSASQSFRFSIPPGAVTTLRW